MSGSASEKVVSVSSRGQATIPKEFREELGIETPGRVKFVRTDDGEILVRPITSITDFRGILADETDDEGRSATDLLRESREADADREEALRRRYAGGEGDASEEREAPEEDDSRDGNEGHDEGDG
jgi:antitoxin PrlF